MFRGNESDRAGEARPSTLFNDNLCWLTSANSCYICQIYIWAFESTSLAILDLMAGIDRLLRGNAMVRTIILLPSLRSWALEHEKIMQVSFLSL